MSSDNYKNILDRIENSMLHKYARFVREGGGVEGDLMPTTGGLYDFWVVWPCQINLKRRGE